MLSEKVFKLHGNNFHMQPCNLKALWRPSWSSFMHAVVLFVLVPNLLFTIESCC